MERTVNKEWRQMFKKDCADKLKASKQEYEEYLSDKTQIVLLQQAGEKLFSVVENWMQVKYSYLVNNYEELKFIARKSDYDTNLLKKTYALHKFFYQNTIKMDADYIEVTYEEVYKIMYQRVHNW